MSIEGAGALGFSKPIKSDAESLSIQASRLANTRQRQEIQRQNYIQKQLERDEATRLRSEMKAYNLTNFSPSSNNTINGIARREIDVRLQDLLQDIQQGNPNISPEKARAIADVKTNTKLFDQQLLQSKAEFNRNKNFDFQALEGDYINTYIDAPNQPINFFETGQSYLTPTQWMQNNASDAQVRSYVKSLPLYWSETFRQKSAQGSERTTQSEIENNQRVSTTEKVEFPVSYTKLAKDTRVSKTPLELMDPSNGPSMLQRTLGYNPNTGDFEDRIALAMLNEQRDIWVESHMNDFVQFKYTDADGKDVEYNKQVADIISDPSDIGNNYLLAEGLRQAVSQYGINRKDRSQTITELVIPPTSSQQRDESNQYSFENRIIRHTNDIVMGGVKGQLGEKQLFDGEVVYPVTDDLFVDVKLKGKAVDLYYNPSQEKFLLVEKNKNLMDYKATEETMLEPTTLMLKAFGSGRATGVSKLMDDKGILINGVYHPEALTSLAERIELDTDADSIYEGIANDVKEILADVTVPSSQNMKDINKALRGGGVKTASGIIKRVTLQDNQIKVSFSNGTRQSLDLNAFKSLLESRQVSAVTNLGEQKTIDKKLLDVLLGRQNNIA